MILILLIAMLFGDEQTEIPESSTAVETGFTAASENCKSDSQNFPKTVIADEQTRISQNIKIHQLTQWSEHLLEQHYLLSSMGVPSPFSNRTVQREVESARNQCSQDPTKKLTAAVEQNLESIQASSTSVSPQKAMLKKRYLAAMLESHRIHLAMTDAPLTADEKSQLLARQRRIQSFYPLAGSRFVNMDQLTVLLKIQGNPVRSRKTHPNIEAFLFPVNGSFQKVESTANTDAGSQVINKLLSTDALPEQIEENLNLSLQLAFNPYMKALGSLCNLKTCDSMYLNFGWVQQEINQAQNGGLGLSAVCQCQLNDNSQDFETAMTLAGIGGVAATGACIFTGWACPVSMGLGLSVASLSAVNGFKALNAINTNIQTIQILAQLPSTQKQELARLKSRQNELNKNFMVSAAMTVGIGAGTTALVKGAQKVAPMVSRAIRRWRTPKIGGASLQKLKSMGYSQDEIDKAARALCGRGVD